MVLDKGLVSQSCGVVSHVNGAIVGDLEYLSGAVHIRLSTTRVSVQLHVVVLFVDGGSFDLHCDILLGVIRCILCILAVMVRNRNLVCTVIYDSAIALFNAILVQVCELRPNLRRINEYLTGVWDVGDHMRSWWVQWLAITIDLS